MSESSRSSSPDQSLLTGRQNASLPWYVREKNQCGPHSWRIRSKGAILLIVWMYCAFVSCSNPALYEYPVLPMPTTFKTFFIIAIAFLIVLGPIAGFTASAYFRRFTMMSAALWLLWIGNTLALPLKLLQMFFPDSQQLLYNFGTVTLQVATYSGFVLLFVNSIPFGLDQMPDASGQQIAAFVHWYGWSAIAGAVTNELINVVLLCVHSLTSNAHILQSFFSVAAISLPLCSLSLFRHWLTIEPSNVNPLKTVCSVLRFSAKHKHPVRRSAFTYCEDRRPSRIDMAKTKFGGPFTNEEVEDVKTCMRMVLVIASISVVVLVILASVSSVREMLEAEFTYSYPIDHCQDQITQLGLLVVLCVILCLPIYKATLDIFNRKCLSTSLRRVGSAQVMVACASLILLALTTTWYISNSPSVCMFASGGSSEFSFDHRWIEIPLTLLLYSSVFFLITAMVEFVCAQAPYNLRGLLMGTLYSICLSSAILGVAIFQVWSHHSYSAGCGVWYYLFVTVTVTLGLVMFCVVAKWYKKREREPPDMYRVFVEAYYDHYIGQ